MSFSEPAGGGDNKSTQIKTVKTVQQATHNYVLMSIHDYYVFSDTIVSYVYSTLLIITNNQFKLAYITPTIMNTPFLRSYE